MKQRLSIWWRLKVMASLALVAVMFLGFAGYDPTPALTRAWTPLGQVLVIAAGLSNLAHFFLLKRVAGDLSRPQRLVTAGGLYRWVRHPMYLGDIGVMLGLALMSGRASAWSLFVLGATAVALLCRREDHAMLTAFPEAFADYRRRTGALFPAFRIAKRP